MTGGSRRAHTKTRNGCGQCKRRRVRCDLRPPICSNCARRGERCDYEEMGIGYPSVSPPTVLQVDLATRLVHHFAQTTSYTLDYPETPCPWRMQIIQRSENTLYIRQCIMAISALHIVHISPPEVDTREYKAKACAYQNDASALFRQQVATVDQNNGLDVLGFCVMVSMFNFRLSLMEHLQAQQSSEIDIFGPLFALRGAAFLIRDYLHVTVHHETLGGCLARLGREARERAAPMDATTQRALDSLNATEQTLTAAGKSTLHSSQAFLILRNTFMHFTSFPKGWLHVLYWPTLIPAEYFTELREGQPAAMAAFIYWCAYMHGAPNLWHIQGWPLAAALAYLPKMGPEYQDVLSWPRERINSAFQSSSG